MAGLPEISMTGTLVADPELRFTPSGAAVVNFTLACNDRKFDKDRNEWVDGDATFLRCNLWRQHAENLAETLSKGHRVMVSGRLRQRSYEKDGEKRTVFEVDVDEAGPSLKFHKGALTKVSGGSGGRPSERQKPAPQQDPWAPTSDEPPF